MKQTDDYYFTPAIDQKVNFYGRDDMKATLVQKNRNLGLFVFDNPEAVKGGQTCYGLPVPSKWKIEE